jgi:hypothetical protein
MRKITSGGLVLAAALVLAGFGVWSNSNLYAKHTVGVGEPSAPPPQISAYEIMANSPKDLPVANYLDLTFIFPSPGCYPATCVP